VKGQVARSYDCRKRSWRREGARRQAPSRLIYGFRHQRQWSRLLVRTLKGNKIEAGGVTPDRTIPLTLADVRQGRDAALEEAQRMLREDSTERLSEQVG
jgi:hypothetical protein